MLSNHFRRGANIALGNASNQFLKGAVTSHLTNPAASFSNTTSTSTSTSTTFPAAFTSSYSCNFSNSSTVVLYSSPINFSSTSQYIASSNRRCFSSASIEPGSDLVEKKQEEKQTVFRSLTPEVAAFIRSEFDVSGSQSYFSS